LNRAFDITTARTLIDNLSSALTTAEGWLLGAIKVESERGLDAREAERTLKDEIAILLAEAVQGEAFKDIPKSTKAFDLALEAERAKISRDPRLRIVVAQARETHRQWAQAQAELERSKTSFDAIKIRCRLVTAGLTLEE
jgi:hypothetical protein